MQANKVPGHKIPEDSKGMYHVSILKRQWDEKNRVAIETSHVAIMSPRDYQTFKKPGMQDVLGYSEATILHDPTAGSKQEPLPEKTPGEIDNEKLITEKLQNEKDAEIAATTELKAQKIADKKAADKLKKGGK